MVKKLPVIISADLDSGDRVFVKDKLGNWTYERKEAYRFFDFYEAVTELRLSLLTAPKDLYSINIRETV